MFTIYSVRFSLWPRCLKFAWKIHILKVWCIQEFPKKYVLNGKLRDLHVKECCYHNWRTAWHRKFVLIFFLEVDWQLLKQRLKLGLTSASSEGKARTRRACWFFTFLTLHDSLTKSVELTQSVNFVQIWLTLLKKIMLPPWIKKNAKIRGGTVKNLKKYLCFPSLPTAPY